MFGPEKARELKIGRDCKAFVTRAIPKIVEDWNYDEWRKRATAELVLATDTKQLRKNFAVYRQFLGRFKDITSPVGGVEIQEIRGKEIPVGTYFMQIRFRGSAASLTVKVVYIDDAWRFRAFSVRTDMVLPIKEVDD